MGIALLGPLTIDGSASALGRRDRVVLAALASRPGEALSSDQIADALWADSPPPSWPKVVQGCIVRLRKVLGHGSIESGAFGYRLVVARDEIDAQRFERAATRARALLSAGQDPDRAAAVLGEALGMWRGEALTELDGWDPGRIEAERLAELRREAEELYAEAHLRAGRVDEVVSRLESMVREAPLRERRWALLALAQYQAGRQSDALRSLRRARALLGRELGLDPGPDLTALEQAVLRQDPSLLVPQVDAVVSAVCPYRGLLPYDTDDAESFFGREDDVDACLRRLGAEGVLAVVGPSGTGKSSLVRAGVVPSLRRDGRQVLVLSPGDHPARALAALPPHAAATVLVVDQLEEVFSLCQDEAERRRFLQALVHHAATGWLVLVLRADHLVDVSASRDLAGTVERGLHLIGPMAPDDLRAAIEQPARLAGLEVEPALVERLVNEVAGNPGSLPMMSHALLETWQRREGRTLTLSGYEASGGIREAVARSAEQAYGAVSTDQQAVLRDLMLRLVAAGPEGEPVRTRQPRRLVVTGPEQERVLDLLVRSRLLTSDADVVEVSHEALARAWPRLRDWLDEDVDGRRILHHLAAAADSWQSLGRPDSELYRGVRLARAVDWTRRAGPFLSVVEREFLESSERAGRAELTAAEDRAREQARTNRRLRVLLASTAALLVTALVVGVVAVRQAGRAERTALASAAHRAGARAMVDPDTSRSLLLAVAAERVASSAESRSDLLAALERHPQLVRSYPLPVRDVTGLDVSPDGRTIAVLDLIGGLRVYDQRTGRLIAADRRSRRPLLQPSDARDPVEFSPDGQTLAVGSPALDPQPVRLLDAETLEPLPTRLPGVPARPTRAMHVAYSADGRYLAAALMHWSDPAATQESTGTLMVWDLRSRRAPRLVLAHPVANADDAFFTDVGLSPDGGRLYTSQPLSAYAVPTGRRLWANPALRSDQLDVSPDGRSIALSQWGFFAPDEQARDVVLADAGDGSVTRRLEGHTERVVQARFSHDGRRLASSGNDHEALVWDLGSGQPVAHLRTEQQDTWGLAFGPGDTALYTAGPDRAVRVWDLAGQDSFLSRDAPAKNFEFGCQAPSPGASTVWHLTGQGMRFVDTATGRSTTPRGPNLEGADTCGSWNGDGTRFAMVRGTDLSVWDARTGRRVTHRDVARTHVSDLDYSADGSRIVVAEDSGRLTLLDAETLRPVARPADLGERARWLTAAPDDRHALVTTGGRLHGGDFSEPETGWALVDLVSGRVTRTGRLPVRDPGGVVYSPDGRRAAFGGPDGEVGLVDPATGRRVGEPARAHTAAVNYMAFNRSGSLLVSSAFDGTVALVDARTGHLLGSVGVPDKTLSSAEFLPDGHTVLIASYNQAIYLWDTRSAHAVAFACQAAGRDLTRAEWRDAFGTEPYRHVCP